MTLTLSSIARVALFVIVGSVLLLNIKNSNTIESLRDQVEKNAKISEAKEKKLQIELEEVSESAVAEKKRTEQLKQKVNSFGDDFSRLAKNIEDIQNTVNQIKQDHATLASDIDRKITEKHNETLEFLDKYPKTTEFESLRNDVKGILNVREPQEDKKKLLESRMALVENLIHDIDKKIMNLKTNMNTGQSYDETDSQETSLLKEELKSLNNRVIKLEHSEKITNKANTIFTNEKENKSESEVHKQQLPSFSDKANKILQNYSDQVLQKEQLNNVQQEILKPNELQTEVKQEDKDKEYLENETQEEAEEKEYLETLDLDKVQKQSEQKNLGENKPLSLFDYMEQEKNKKETQEEQKETENTLEETENALEETENTQEETENTQEEPEKIQEKIEDTQEKTENALEETEDTQEKPENIQEKIEDTQEKTESEELFEVIQQAQLKQTEQDKKNDTQTEVNAQTEEEQEENEYEQTTTDEAEKEYIETLDLDKKLENNQSEQKNLGEKKLEQQSSEDTNESFYDQHLDTKELAEFKEKQNQHFTNFLQDPGVEGKEENTMTEQQSLEEELDVQRFREEQNEQNQIQDEKLDQMMWSSSSSG